MKRQQEIIQTGEERVVNIYKYLIGERKENRARFCSVVSSRRTRGSGHKPKYRKYLNVRKKMRVFFL